MKLLLRQLRRWRFRERLVRFAWGTARWVAAVLTVLAAACLADWLYDRYAEVPFALRILVTAGQVALAGGLAYAFILRPLQRTPPLDALAFRAEKEIPEFDHRLVTALQLNRDGARTAGMSAALIAEVTREAGEMAARHRLTRLIDYRPVWYALGVVAPAVLAWVGFAAADPALAAALLKRQALLGADIPRSVALANETQEVWPSGSEVTIRYRVTGAWAEGMTGTAGVRPDGQPADDYPLVYEQPAGDGAAYFVAKLPPSSTPFAFRGRLADGRARADGRVDFEPPPQVTDVEAWQLLPTYLGWRTVEHDGKPVKMPYERIQPRGEVVNALPESGVRVDAKFNKPVVKAVLVRVDRGEGNKEIDGTRQDADELGGDGATAGWTFRTTPKTIAYRLELTDARGFTSPAPARRGVRMLPDEPPAVEFHRDSTRDPDPAAFYGKGDPRLYEWDLSVAWRPAGGPGEGETGPVRVVYSARSELGVGRANIAYRVIPKGEPVENVHPRDDPGEKWFKRLPLTPVVPPPPEAARLGKWVPDLGLFEKSFAGVGDFERRRLQVELFRVPSPSPETEPGELEAGGRYNFQTNGLRKAVSDGPAARLEPGDTVELYVEVFDKYAGHLADRKLPPRAAGYTREAKRRTVVTEAEAEALTQLHRAAESRLQDKLRTLAEDQRDVFQPKKKPAGE